MRVVSLTLAVALASTGCRKTVVATPPAAPPTLVPGMFINAPGSWWGPLGPGSFELSVSGSGKSFNYEGTTFKTRPPSKEGLLGRGGAPITIPEWPPDWFVYVEETGSRVSLLYYGSGKRLWRRILKPGETEGQNTMIIGEAGKEPRLRVKDPQLPSAAFHRLPPELQKLLPPPSAEQKPSI